MLKMVKKNNDIAFVPLAPVQLSQVEAPTKIDTPNYPDMGVSFANYSKKLQSGNTFRLSKQEPYERQTTFGWTASNALLTLSFDNKDGKTIFVESITISGFTDTACYWQFADYTSGTDYNTIALMACGAAQSNSITVHFAAPIPLRKTTFAAQPNVAITGRIAVVISGWYEDNL